MQPTLPRAGLGAQGRGWGAQHTRPDTNPSVFQDSPLSHLSLFQLSWKKKELKAMSQELVAGP